jgi:hypothetical protein
VIVTIEFSISSLCQSYIRVSKRCDLVCVMVPVKLLGSEVIEIWSVLRCIFCMKYIGSQGDPLFLHLIFPGAECVNQLLPYCSSKPRKCDATIIVCDCYIVLRKKKLSIMCGYWSRYIHVLGCFGTLPRHIITFVQWNAPRKVCNAGCPHIIQFPKYHPESSRHRPISPNLKPCMRAYEILWRHQ